MWIPSGFSDDIDHYDVEVVEGGTCLNLMVSWPNPFITTEWLFAEDFTQREQSFKIFPDHPKIGGFIDDMRSIQGRSGAPATATANF